MKIPEEKIQEVREAVDIVQVVSQFVTLKKSGRTFMGRCPFHNEKTPSFSVDPARGFYHCFGCGVGGNVFTFLMEMEKVSFPEAVRTLAQKAGIHLPEYDRDDQAAQESEQLYHANRFASEFFQLCLYETRAGALALDYMKSRGFTDETIKTFKLGYAPNRWDGLILKARRDGVPMEALTRAGLILTRKDGQGFYDRFRGRVMFPILNSGGREVGFGGRVFKDDKGPKYLNSPETPVYQKSRLLYGLFQSKNGLRRENRLLLVEGYTDVMRLFQCGFDYCAATSGTALTDGQAKLISRYTKKVLLLYDGDSAGFNAALRGVDVLTSAGLDVEVSPLPGGSDPDSFLREHPAEALQERLDQAQSFIDFRLARMNAQGQLHSPSDKAEAARRLLETIGRIPDPVKRSLMIKDASEKLGVDENLLMQQMKRPAALSPVQETDAPAVQEQTRVDLAEAGLLSLLLDDGPRWSPLVFPFLTAADFNNSAYRTIAGKVWPELEKGRFPGLEEVLNWCQDDPLLARGVMEIETVLHEMAGDLIQFGLDCLLVIKAGPMRKRVQLIREEIRQMESRGKNPELLSRKLLETRNEYQKEIHEIETLWKKEVEKE